MATLEKRTPAKRTPWAWTIATFFGVGNLKPGPGTYGSVAAMLLWMLAGRYFVATDGHVSIGDNTLVFHTHLAFFATLTALAAILITLLGIPASTLVANEAGREDPGFVVIDEVAGQLITLIGLTPTWPHALLALLLFRLFDIFKPWPIRRFEAFPGGKGIMLDDFVAGLFALLCVQILTHLLPALH